MSKVEHLLFELFPAGTLPTVCAGGLKSLQSVMAYDLTDLYKEFVFVFSKCKNVQEQNVQRRPMEGGTGE